MNDLAQALAERVPGWWYKLEPSEVVEDMPWIAWAENAEDVSAWCFADTPAGAVRMLNDALREVE